MANTTFVLVYPSGAASGAAPARYYIGDTFAGLPLGNEGDIAYAIDTKLVYSYYSSAWHSPLVLNTVSLTNQSADITSTNFANITNGQYLITYSILDTTSDITAGAVTLTIGYTDDAGATTQTAGPLALTSLGRLSGTFVVQRASTNITYAISHTGLFGSAKFALYLGCIKVI